MNQKNYSKLWRDNMSNDDEILEKQCKKAELDYQLASKLKAKIFPLLEEAHKRLDYRFDKTFIEHIKGTKIRHDNSKRILLLLHKKLSPRLFSLKEHAVITLHLEYLTLVEGILAPETNFLIFTLIANGHDFDSSRKESVKTLSDIEKVSLASRLKFLRKHKFEKLIANKVNVKLRNSVAHLFYEIDEDFKIKVGDKTITRAQYSKLYDDLRNVSYAIHLINLLYYKRFA